MKIVFENENQAKGISKLGKGISVNDKRVQREYQSFKTCFKYKTFIITIFRDTYNKYSNNKCFIFEASLKSNSMRSGI